MSVLVDFSVFPLDKGESVSSYVAEAVRIIKESGLPYKLGPMGTCLEGDYEQVMAVVHRSFKEMQKECRRIYMALKVDYRQDVSDRLEGKVASVMKKID
ncbi:MAG: MTH1187 family thiamine-binding protein [Deltaproteobacteria bacterium]|nr:MTH1187 family thiamine-binding protein [Deltaproteobacteria bacterium]MBW2070643.1 MTH1187 family thiamine-binding protein [Deltaproteobacteria bacterium]